MRDELFERALAYFRACSDGGAQDFWGMVPGDKQKQSDALFVFAHFTGAHIRFGRYSPHYNTVEDTIYMFSRGVFPEKRFCEILVHELVHWSAPRLNRRGLPYAMEEFVAQYGGNLLLEHHGCAVGEMEFDYFRHYAESSAAAECMLRQAQDMARRATEFLLERAERNRSRHT